MSNARFFKPDQVAAISTHAILTIVNNAFLHRTKKDKEALIKCIEQTGLAQDHDTMLQVKCLVHHLYGDD